MHPMAESEWTMMASDWWTIRMNSDVGIGMDHDGIRLDNRNELRCRNRNVLNVGIGMLDNRNALEKCWHRNELKWRHRNAPDVSIGMYSMSALECRTLGTHSKNVGIGMN